MILSNLKLINFRNYDNLDLTFSKGLNFIVGENASGKTNLVESIFYLSLARSFKTHNDLEAIKVNSYEDLIKGKIYSNDIFNNLSIKITSKGKIIYLNDKKINKLSELTKYLNVLLFVPSDTNLMKNSPKERRFFLNLNLSKMSLSYQNALINYEKLLKERNNELKKEKVDLSQYLEGTRVYHKKFGEGTICKTEQEGNDLKVDIAFDKVGHKRLMAKFANLQIL